MLQAVNLVYGMVVPCVPKLDSKIKDCNKMKYNNKSFVSVNMFIYVDWDSIYLMSAISASSLAIRTTISFQSCREATLSGGL